MNKRVVIPSENFPTAMATVHTGGDVAPSRSFGDNHIAYEEMGCFAL